MCRLLLMPPLYSKEDAETCMDLMHAGNPDGSGSVYLKDCKFIVNKWAMPWNEVHGKQLPIFKHMPWSTGWTIGHLRAASCGKPRLANTHPFTNGEWAVAHNGNWHDSEMLRKFFGHMMNLKGETDSEVFAYLLNEIGPKKLYSNLSTSQCGVIAALNTKGHLWIIKRGWTIFRHDAADKKRSVFTTESIYERDNQLSDGWYHFDETGKELEKFEDVWPKTETYKSHHAQRQGSFSGASTNYRAPHSKYPYIMALKSGVTITIDDEHEERYFKEVEGNGTFVAQTPRQSDIFTGSGNDDMTAEKLKAIIEEEDLAEAKSEPIKTSLSAEDKLDRAVASSIGAPETCPQHIRDWLKEKHIFDKEKNCWVSKEVISASHPKNCICTVCEEVCRIQIQEGHPFDG